MSAGLPMLGEAQTARLDKPPAAALIAARRLTSDSQSIIDDGRGGR